MISINIYNLFNRCVVLFVLSTLTQTLWPFSINQIVGFFVFIVLLCMVGLNRSRNVIIRLFGASISVVFLFLISDEFGTSLVNAVYWLNAIMIFSLTANRRVLNKLWNSIIHVSTYIKIIICSANALIIISLFSEKCYNYVWGGVYFRGYTVSQHTLSSACCLLMGITLLYLMVNITEQKRSIWDIVYFLPSVIAVLQSGARTFLVPAFIIIVYFYLYYLKRIAVKSVVFPFMVVVLVYIVLNSNVFTKFSALSVLDINAMTSGRLEFWSADILAFKEVGLINKLLGSGFEFVTKVNYLAVGMSIGAHNDFLSCLLGLGILGLIQYVLAIFSSFIYAIKERVSLGRLVLLMLYLFVPAFLNGFYGYQALMYSYMYLAVTLFVDKTN